MRFCRLHSSLLAASVVLTGAAFFWFSWKFRAFAIVKPLPQFGSIVPWTILLESMLAISLVLLAWGTGLAKSSVFKTIANLFAGAAFLAAGVFLAEGLSGHTFANFDRWWFPSSIAYFKDAFPGRPSPQTSITICFFAVAAIVFHPSASRRILASQLLTAGGLFMPFLAALGYIFYVTPIFAGKPFFLGMSLPTLFLFVGVAFGLFSLCPMRGLVGIVTSNGLSGKTARHLLGFVLPIPVGLGWMLSYVTQRGLLSEQVAAALGVLIVIVLLTILTMHLAAMIRKHEDSQNLAAAAREKLVVELRQQRKRLNDILATLPGIVWESLGRPLAGGEKLSFVSDHVRDMLGYSVEECLTTPDFRVKLIHPDDLGPCARELAASFAAGKIGTMQFRLLQKSGRYIWVETHTALVCDETGAPTGMRGVMLDIAERKQAEQRLSESEEHNRLIIETAYDAFVEMDASGIIVNWNPQAATIFGWSKEQALGRDLAETIIPEKLRLRHTQGLQRFMSTGEGPVLRKRAEINALHREGHEFPVELMIWPVRNHKGWHFNAFVHDIAGRKQAEQQLQEAKAIAEAANRAKSDFLANMSHEIRTPMNGVIGMTGLLLETPLTNEQRDFAETIRASAEALLTIINDILDFSKIEAGKLVFETLDFDLVETVESTLDMLADRAQAKDLELAGAIAPDVPPRLRGDPGRLRQILTNLIGNALKFTSKGEVIVWVSKVSEIETHAEVRFEVQDTGIGIPPEAQTRLFQAFSQADNSITRKYGGTGLGLVISKQLVALMEGKIGIQSESGKGSTFWFTAKFEKQTGEAEMRHASVPHRVLVVDDNHTNRQILRNQVAAWRMQVGIAASGAEALEQLRTAVVECQPYDVALLDVQMPEMDGFTLAATIKADPALVGTRLIMLTSMGHVISSTELKKLGIEAYLLKPVKQSRLFDCLTSQFRSSETTKGTAGVPDLITASSPSVSKIEPEFKKGRILLAEDNAVNQKVALAQLHRLRYRADAVVNGREVLEALQRVPYDLIFMDCQMPELDGYEAARAIRQRENRSDSLCPWKSPVHIIALTAHAMQEDREKCINAGMDDYLSKPIRPAELQAALERWQATVQRLNASMEGADRRPLNVKRYVP